MTSYRYNDFFSLLFQGRNENNVIVGDTSNTGYPINGEESQGEQPVETQSGETQQGGTQSGETQPGGEQPPVVESSEEVIKCNIENILTEVNNKDGITHNCPEKELDLRASCYIYCKDIDIDNISDDDRMKLMNNESIGRISCGRVYEGQDSECGPNDRDLLSCANYHLPEEIKCNVGSDDEEIYDIAMDDKIIVGGFITGTTVVAISYLLIIL